MSGFLWQGIPNKEGHPAFEARRQLSLMPAESREQSRIKKDIERRLEGLAEDVFSNMDGALELTVPLFPIGESKNNELIFGSQLSQLSVTAMKKYDDNNLQADPKEWLVLNGTHILEVGDEQKFHLSIRRKNGKLHLGELKSEDFHRFHDDVYADYLLSQTGFALQGLGYEKPKKGLVLMLDSAIAEVNIENELKTVADALFSEKYAQGEILRFHDKQMYNHTQPNSPTIMIDGSKLISMAIDATNYYKNELDEHSEKIILEWFDLEMKLVSIFGEEFERTIKFSRRAGQLELVDADKSIDAMTLPEKTALLKQLPNALKFIRGALV